MTLSSADRRAVSGLMGDVAKLQREVKLIASRKPGLAQSSIENGSIDGYDAAGNQTVQIGKQQDGTNASTSLSGPKPPTPWFPSASAVPGVVEVRWNGKFAGGAVSPMDFKHVAAYVVPVGTVVDLSGQSGVMTGELGDTVQAQVGPGVYDVFLAAWSLSGKVSELAGPVSVAVPDLVDAEAIGGRLDEADAAIAGVRGDLATQGAELTGRLATAESELGTFGQTVSALEDDVVVAAKTAAVENLYVTGSGTMSEAVINRLFADVVLSRKIAAEQIALGDFTNYVNNADLKVGDGGWYFQAGVSPTSVEGVRCVEYLPSGSHEAVNSALLSVKPGDVVRFSAVVWSPGYAGNPGGLRAVQVDADGNTVTGPSIRNFSPSDVPETYSSDYTIPEGVAGVRYRFATAITSGVIYMREPELRKLNAGQLIADGDVTASKITASEELTAKVGEFLKVNADMIESNAIDGMVITGAVVQSPGSGAGYQLTDNGYTSRDAGGNVTIRMPADGSPAQFRGDVEARSLTASGRVSLQAPENEVASGASLVLESGVAAPLTPPSVGSEYETINLPAPPERADVAGLANAAGLWWRAVNVLGTGDGDRIEGLDTSGTVKVSSPITLDARNGLCVIGDEVHILGKRHDRPENERWVQVYKVTATTATYKRQWEYAYYGSGTYQPGIGTDGAVVLISQCLKTGELTWANYDKVTGAQSAHVTSPYKLAGDVAGVYRGAGDLGQARVVVARKSGPTHVLTTAGSLVDGEGWQAAGRNTVYGLAWAGGAFCHLTDAGVVKYTANTGAALGASADTNDWWLTQTWTGAGGVETLAGPAQRFQFLRRSGLQMSGAQKPPGVTGARFYLAKSATEPARTAYHLVAEHTDATARVGTLPSNWQSQAAPPSSNTFPETTPGSVASRIGGFEVRGDGSGSWGPLTFNRNGTMSSADVPEWVPVTTFAPGFSPGGTGYVPAYRVWPDGKVEWRGVVSGTTSALATVLDVPAVAQPKETVNWVGAATRNSGYPHGVCRVQIAGGDMVIYPGAGTLGFVSLDGLYYYQD